MKKNTSIKKNIRYNIIIIGFITFIISIIATYVIFIPMMTNSAIEDAQNINNEVIQYFDNLGEFVYSSTENLSAAVQDSNIIQNYFNNPNNTNRHTASITLSGLTSREGIIRTSAIEVENTVRLDSINKGYSEDYTILDSDWYKDIHNSSFGHGFSSVYTYNIRNVSYKSIAYVQNFYQNNRKISYVMFVSIDSTINLIKSSAIDMDYFALVDSQGNIFYESGNSKWSEYGSCILNDKMLNILNKDKDKIGIKNISINNKFGIISVVSRGTILKAFLPTFIGIVIVLFLFLTLTLFAITKSMNLTIDPILELNEKMKIAAKGNLECSVDFNRCDEIGMLGESFNKMLNDIKNYLVIISKSEEKNQKAKYSLLISQINPHFIYNTINSINYLARKQKYEDIVEVNTALICILRDRLRINDIQITDTIEQEIKVLKQYLIIQKHMYAGNLEVEWDIDQSLLNHHIPKNLIQPLIENSLFHALIDEESGEISGKIIIKIECIENEIKITVTDNGTGMSQDRLNQVRDLNYCSTDRGNNIGISNIRGRLFYLYGNSKCMIINSELHKGTVIILTLPLID